jgi:DNA-binding transcriptional MerR regulator
VAEALHIGVAAKLAAVSIDTVRFYERLGLTRPGSRSPGGYRLFDEDQIRDLRFIRHAQELGFSLTEIKQLLALRQKQHACPQVQTMLERKLANVREKIKSLSHLERELAGALRNCNHELRQKWEITHEDCCPLLTKLDQRDGLNGKKYVSRKPRSGKN